MAETPSGKVLLRDPRLKPNWMPQAQWDDRQAADAAQKHALERGIGIVQTSARRYAVVRTNGASASREFGGAWYGYVSFHIVDGGLNLTYNQARRLLYAISLKMDFDPRYRPEMKWWHS